MVNACCCGGIAAEPIAGVEAPRMGKVSPQAGKVTHLSPFHSQTPLNSVQRMGLFRVQVFMKYTFLEPAINPGSFEGIYLLALNVQRIILVIREK